MAQDVVAGAALGPGLLAASAAAVADTCRRASASPFPTPCSNPAGGEPHPPPGQVLQEIEAPPTQLEVSGKTGRARHGEPTRELRARVSAPGAISRAIFVVLCCCG
jgi:hypothetical protein